MTKFQDNKGFEWLIEINVNSVRRVKTLLDVNLAQLDESLIARLATDPCLLCDVIYVLCKTQAEGASVSDEDFGRAMAGDAIDAATKALLEELVNFFRNPEVRGTLTKAMDKQRCMEAMGVEAMNRYLDSDQAEKAMAEQIDRILTTGN